MPNHSYQRGAAFERAVIKQLEEAGFAASRTAGSHSPVDVTGYNEEILRLIQCKTTLKKPAIKQYIDDLRKLSAVKCPPNVVKELLIKYKRTTTRILIL